MGRSEELFEQAKQVMPGGVNSPVRAFNAVGGAPRFIKSGRGARITDEDNVTYIDFVGTWGPRILGDRLVPGMEMVRMVNSGTEAVMSALRLARGYTGREKLIKFAGCYHGHSDSMLVKAGSGALTNGKPDSAGVTRGAAQDTLLAQYNDLSSVEQLFQENPGEIAALIVEPVGANMGVVPPAPGFLQGLRKLCDENGALLIFDEVITGFRLALGGAQEYYGVQADLVTYGKIIGAGMPVGAYGGKKAIMSQVSPLGSVDQACTLSANPVAMAA